MYGRGWTKDEMWVARQLRQSGHTYDEIAKILGRKFRSVKDFLLRNHIYPSNSAKHFTMRRASVAREERKREIEFSKRDATVSVSYGEPLRANAPISGS